MSTKKAISGEWLKTVGTKPTHSFNIRYAIGKNKPEHPRVRFIQGYANELVPDALGRRIVELFLGSAELSAVGVTLEVELEDALCYVADTLNMRGDITVQIGE